VERNLIKASERKTKFERRLTIIEREKTKKEKRKRERHSPTFTKKSL